MLPTINSLNIDNKRCENNQEEHRFTNLVLEIRSSGGKEGVMGLDDGLVLLVRGYLSPVFGEQYS